MPPFAPADKPPALCVVVVVAVEDGSEDDSEVGVVSSVSGGVDVAFGVIDGVAIMVDMDTSASAFLTIRKPREDDSGLVSCHRTGNPSSERGV